MAKICEGVLKELPLVFSDRLDCLKVIRGDGIFENRISLDAVWKSLNYDDSRIEQFLSLKSGIRKTLDEMGYIHMVESVRPIDERGRKISGVDFFRTISIKNFNFILMCEALENKNDTAIKMLGTFSQCGIEDVINKLFQGVSLSYFNHTATHYYGWRYKPGEREELAEEDREDRANLVMGVSDEYWYRQKAEEYLLMPYPVSS